MTGNVFGTLIIPSGDDELVTRPIGAHGAVAAA